MQSHIRTMHAYLAVTSWLGSANVQFDAYSTWMTCDCSANKHWVHVYMYLRRMTSWLGSVDIAMTCDYAGDYAVSTSSEHLSLSLSTDIYIYIYIYTHTHTHTWEELVTVQYQQTVSAHVPKKNDLWLCSINKQWVHMYLRRMTCDCAVSTNSECTCTWEEWLVTV